MADFSAKFYANFIKDDRWLGLVSGLKVTIAFRCYHWFYCSDHSFLP